jgi:branched-subunit amino acid transport protein
MTAMLVAVVVLALINFAFKAIGPAILTDHEFGPRLQAVVDSFSAALLAGLLAVGLLGQHWAAFDWTTLPGLAAAAVAWRLRAPQLLCIAFGVGVTVVIRLAAQQF